MVSEIRTKIKNLYLLVHTLVIISIRSLFDSEKETVQDFLSFSSRQTSHNTYMMFGDLLCEILSSTNFTT